MPADPVALARDLLRCRSITPAEGGALAFLEDTLKAAGFDVRRMTFREPGADDVENLYVVDGSFFPSSAAVNPGLTIVAQALRVADHIRRTDLRLPEDAAVGMPAAAQRA